MRPQRVLDELRDLIESHKLTAQETDQLLCAFISVVQTRPALHERDLIGVHQHACKLINQRKQLIN